VPLRDSEPWFAELYVAPVIANVFELAESAHVVDEELIELFNHSPTNPVVCIAACEVGEGIKSKVEITERISDK
jgi:hypothetical protein